MHHNIPALQVATVWVAMASKNIWRLKFRQISKDRFERENYTYIRQYTLTPIIQHKEFFIDVTIFFLLWRPFTVVGRQKASFWIWERELGALHTCSKERFMARGGRLGGRGEGEEGVRSFVWGYTPLQMMDACLALRDLHFCSGFEACARS